MAEEISLEQQRLRVQRNTSQADLETLLRSEAQNGQNILLPLAWEAFRHRQQEINAQQEQVGMDMDNPTATTFQTTRIHKDLNPGIENIGMKRATLFCKIQNINKILEDPELGHKETFKTFPTLPLSASEQNQADYETLRRNNILAIRNETLERKRLLEDEYTNAISLDKIKLGFPETTQSNCIPEMRLTEVLFSQLQEKIKEREWSLSAKMLRKQQEDIAKRTIKEKKMEEIKERKKLMEDPSKKLDLLSSQLKKLMLRDKERINVKITSRPSTQQAKKLPGAQKSQEKSTGQSKKKEGKVLRKLTKRN